MRRAHRRELRWALVPLERRGRIATQPLGVGAGPFLGGATQRLFRPSGAARVPKGCNDAWKDGERCAWSDPGVDIRQNPFDNPSDDETGTP